MKGYNKMRRKKQKRSDWAIAGNGVKASVRANLAFSKAVSRTVFASAIASFKRLSILFLHILLLEFILIQKYNRIT